MAWTDPATFSTAEVVTATKLNTHVRDNMRELWHEIAYVEFTANVTVTSTTLVAVVSSGAITYAAVPTVIEFYSPMVTLPGTVTMGVHLGDVSAATMGRLATVGANAGLPVFVVRRFTPTAASHTYRIDANLSTGSSATVGAGAGGADVLLPGYIRIWVKGGA